MPQERGIKPFSCNHFPIFNIFWAAPNRSHNLDDSGLDRDWQLHVRVDEEVYQNALAIDKIWRGEKRYILRPAWGGKTYSCRDYCMQIAETCGLRVRYDKWADFPPITFREFLIDNGIIKKRGLKFPRLIRQKPVYAS